MTALVVAPALVVAAAGAVAPTSAAVAVAVVAPTSAAVGVAPASVVAVAVTAAVASVAAVAASVTPSSAAAIAVPAVGVARDGPRRPDVASAGPRNDRGPPALSQVGRGSGWAILGSNQ
ncbi:hypothetical protein ACIRBZ_25670 [Streptomyces sp. NPDC094038]|uniref:hypothetical protein n=1 Tax=Streptomyces sp. NPDC094038 TaxID=3366055 RepID=UPI0038281EB9